MINLESINQTVLGKIIADKQLWVEARKSTQPLADFIDTLTPSDRDFTGALSGRTGFILECKKASPSRG